MLLWCVTIVLSISWGHADSELLLDLVFNSKHAETTTSVKLAIGTPETHQHCTALDSSQFGACASLGRFTRDMRAAPILQHM